MPTVAAGDMVLPVAMVALATTTMRYVQTTRMEHDTKIDATGLFMHCAYLYIIN